MNDTEVIRKLRAKLAELTASPADAPRRAQLTAQLARQERVAARLVKKGVKLVR